MFSEQEYTITMRKLTESEVRQNIHSWIENSGSLRKFAKNTGVSPSFLSEMLSGKKRFSTDFLHKIRINRVVNIHYEIED